jgi:hypothetical protein
MSVLRSEAFSTTAMGRVVLTTKSGFSSEMGIPSHIRAPSAPGNTIRTAQLIEVPRAFSYTTEDATIKQQSYHEAICSWAEECVQSAPQWSCERIHVNIGGVRGNSRDAASCATVDAMLDMCACTLESVAEQVRWPRRCCSFEEQPYHEVDCLQIVSQVVDMMRRFIM